MRCRYIPRVGTYAIDPTSPANKVFSKFSARHSKARQRSGTVRTRAHMTHTFVSLTSACVVVLMGLAATWCTSNVDSMDSSSSTERTAIDRGNARAGNMVHSMFADGDGGTGMAGARRGWARRRQQCWSVSVLLAL